MILWAPEMFHFSVVDDLQLSSMILMTLSACMIFGQFVDEVEASRQLSISIDPLHGHYPWHADHLVSFLVDARLKQLCYLSDLHPDIV